MTNESNTQPKTSMNNNFAIGVRQQTDESAKTHINVLTTPATLIFSIIPAEICKLEIKKIVWDFGNDTKEKAITNRKGNLTCHEVACKYKKSHGKTITISASVYTDSGVFIPPTIQTITENVLLKEHYINPEEFKDEIVTYYNTGVFSRDVGESICKIAKRLAFASNFINYTYRDDMVGDAIVRMTEALISKKIRPRQR